MENKNLKLISVKEFCSEYGIGYNKGYQMVHSEGFPMLRLGKKILIIQSKVEEWLVSQIGKSF